MHDECFECDNWNGSICAFRLGFINTTLPYSCPMLKKIHGDERDDTAESVG